jgi:hypothetical protein
MAELRPVFTITYGSGLPLPIQVTGIVPRPFQVVDQRQIRKVIREIMPPDAIVIIDTGAFQGHSINARDYVQAIREAHGEKPIVLFLRHGTPNDNTIEGDQIAGATDVLYHSAVTEASDTRRMNHFIREGILPPPPEKKRAPGSVASAINALNRRANHESEPTGSDTSIHSPGPHEKPSPPGKSPMKHIVSTTPAASTPGDQEMEALLVELHAIAEQNTRITVRLEGVQERIRDILAKKSEAVDTAPAIGIEDTPAPIAPAKGVGSMAVLTKYGWEGTLEIFGRNIVLLYAAAQVFAHLINTGETMGVKEISNLYRIGEPAAYARITNLLAELEKCRPGLSSCLTPVKSGRSIRYRFDEVAFRKAFGIK